ncbi:MAG: hypothetical protein COB16_00275 [Rhodobacteraceae bacterium]|nr:MAG: hypothetical protein COB16_00275 [Paracoccaceae bacterium]
METLILFSVSLSAVAVAHLLALWGRYLVILGFLLATGVLYGVIHWYVGTLDGWNGLALAIFALIAVMPFGAGLVLGTLTGWLHARRRIARRDR